MNQIFWYFDFISPFAYLQFQELHRLCDPHQINLRPILLAGLLGHWGQKGPAEIASKRLFTYRHVLWLAKRKGLEMRLPEGHPFNPLFGLRLATACECRYDVVAAIFDHIWRAGKTFQDVDENADLAERLGVNIAKVNAASVKHELRNSGERALEMGVFGVPTLIIENRLFWGLDATQMAADFLAGDREGQDEVFKSVEKLPVFARRK